ncbi:deoxyribodipyrimidine photolyase [Terriglobus roseus DSM 18391]|uniref:Deoxyribodipyrimidine photo-lyase n=1 Tax=Terriglobus roseus (strain DSM 18391 / NRRL B-41598 / KBS 63) TaxID=926566 RepID=I3ZK25_TERRK|nr:deoxyribodipyrimidine photo-lyase [Terriglobus roseus]AFL89593.1 deoxyribodipyrimidine photolyase [Terriglobus roseus DSM 18391]
MAPRKGPSKAAHSKTKTAAAPPNEKAQDAAAPGMSEPDAKRIPHPAREKAIHAATSIRETAKRAGKTSTSKRSKKAIGSEREHREAAAYEALSPDLPEALRRIASNDRVTVRRDGAPKPDGKVVVYWMQRAERGVDNPALDVAVEVANELGLPVVAFFSGVSNFPHGVLRGYIFLNEGLRDVETDLRERNVPFILRNAPHEDRLQFFQDVDAAIVIGDENPMRVPEGWRKQVQSKLKMPFWTVDADVIVPTKRYEKAPYAAYTIRGRLWKMLPEYLEESTNPRAKHTWHKPHGFRSDDPQEDMTKGWKDLDRTVGKAEDLDGGSHAALRRLKHFVTHLLPSYAQQRNHPEVDGTSLLSPYLHFGHISPLRIYLEIEKAAAANPKLRESADSFLDEMVTWRELCIAWVKWDPNYDNPETAEAWARKTVEAHAHDKREHLYTLKQLEPAETYDELWNAAQRQMVRRGWMHNMMRMYWAKKVLEWSHSNADAMKALIHLNDKYFLDGRDPGGYAGIAWAVYGKFDRPWGERPIFGKIRYMSGASTGRKFNSRAYIEQNPPLDKP